MAGQMPKSYASVAAIRIVKAPTARQQPKASPSSAAEHASEATESDGEHSHTTTTTNPEIVQDAKGNKRRQVKQGSKKTKEKIAEDARAQGVIVIPGAKPQELDEDSQELHQGYHENCRCTFCKCKFCADPSEQNMCGDRCVICQNINQMLHNQATELKAEHNRQIEDLMQAMDDLDKGLLEERRAVLAEERRQRELRERNQVLNAQFTELKERCAAAEKRHAALKQDLAREERIRKQHEKLDLEERRRDGNFWMPIH